MKKVFQYNSKSGELLDEFPSARYLDQEYGLSPDIFRKHIDTNKEYKRYLWSYTKADNYSDISSNVIHEETINEEGKYDVVDGFYVWKSKRGVIKISVQEADKMFQDYSEKGMNLTQSQMRRKYELEPYEWHSIKNTLLLYKQSHIFSPYTVENTDEAELKIMMENKIRELYKNQGAVIEDAYRKATYKEYRKAINGYNKKSFAHEEMMNGLTDLLPTLSHVTIRETADPGEIDELNVSIADLHTGAGVKNLQATKDYDIDVLEEKMLKLSQDINAMKAKKVNLLFLGDLIESFTGLNHSDSWKDIQWGYYGAQVVFSAYKIITTLISNTNNISYIGGIGGNHDRGASSKQEDSKGEVAKLIFMFLKENLGSTIDVEYKDYVLVKNSGNIRIIITHGDHGNIKKPLKMVADYGNTNMFNLILSGHLHSRSTDEDSHNVRALKCPSIFTGNNYSERNGWTSTSAALFIHDTPMGVPKIIDNPL